jgi:glutamate---cysteine ligase / carboxylate-amine ligase
MSRRPAFHLFERFGVELEYMIVHADSLAVLPIADRVLHAVAGRYLSEIEMGSIAWSNELALHVIELKTNGPAPALDGLADDFQSHVAHINRILEPLGGRLMPTAMHPWMDPQREMRLWPHEHSPVYEAFNRIFDCRGHGWANLQSVHLNLPFADDEEFARLHAAIRLLLPLMPALAASSPIVDGRPTGQRDSRLEVYRHNGRRIPRMAGRVIPEPVYCRRDYEREILQPLYRDIAPLDPASVLQHEWLNARGAIARFDRNTIEIRVLDVQECPQADLAVCRLITDTLRALCEERWLPLAQLQAFTTESLQGILLDTIRDAEAAQVHDPAYAAALGYPLAGAAACTAGQLWQHLHQQLHPAGNSVAATEVAPGSEGTKWTQAEGTPENRSATMESALQTLLCDGSLASRILRCGDNPPRPAIARRYRDLCDCLAAGTMYRGDE